MLRRAPVYTTMKGIMRSAKTALKNGLVTTIAYGVVGWALCGVMMGLGIKLATLEIALIAHAVAAPLIFVALSLMYFRRFGCWSPLLTAAVFLGVVVILDTFVVALLIERSFEMFGSILGTWLPFFLVFISSWWTGVFLRRTAHHATR